MSSVNDFLLVDKIDGSGIPVRYKTETVEGILVALGLAVVCTASANINSNTVTKVDGTGAVHADSGASDIANSFCLVGATTGNSVVCIYSGHAILDCVVAATVGDKIYLNNSGQVSNVAGKGTSQFIGIATETIISAGLLGVTFNPAEWF